MNYLLAVQVVARLSCLTMHTLAACLKSTLLAGQRRSSDTTAEHGVLWYPLPKTSACRGAARTRLKHWLLQERVPMAKSPCN
jgi:hypothetical protein